MSTTLPITINQLKTNFQDYLQAQNSNINARAINTMWDIIAGAQAGSQLDLYYTLQLVINSIYVQNSVGDQVDRALYAAGLPGRGGLTYGIATCVMLTGTPAVIPANTIFTDSTTGIQFQTLQIFDIADDTIPIYLYAVIPGNTALIINGSTLTGSTFTLTVQASTNGQLEESDASCINRLLQNKRAPLSGARSTDYEVYALKANVLLLVPVITGAIVIPSFLLINNVGRLGVFPIGGAPITEYQLNQGLLPTTTFVQYTRAVNGEAEDAVATYVQSLRLVGTDPVIGTCLTHEISPLTINVVVPSPYDDNSFITLESQDQAGNPISITLTVTQLIQRELRRAICNQPFGATTINGANYITLEDLYTLLNAQLSYQNGALAQLILNMSIDGGDISVPYYTDNTTNIYYVYDFSQAEGYSNITVMVTTST